MIQKSVFTNSFKNSLDSCRYFIDAFTVSIYTFYLQYCSPYAC